MEISAAEIPSDSIVGMIYLAESLLKRMPLGGTAFARGILQIVHSATRRRLLRGDGGRSRSSIAGSFTRGHWR